MKPRPTCAAAFTLVEALVVVAVLGLVATVVVPRIQEGPDAAKLAKLQQDVAIVNNAIDAYLVAGGSQGALNAGNVVEALKQRVSGGVAAEMMGAIGPFLDPRVVTNATDFAWSARFETSPRPRFVVQRSSNGIVFARGLPSLVGGPAPSSGPSWLWSYTPASPGQVAKPVFQPAAVDAGTTLGTTNTVLIGLSCPIIIPPSQTFELTDYPLNVQIDNSVNPAGSSITYYRIGTTGSPDSGSWTLWVGSPFTVNPDSLVTTVAVSVDPSRYYNSPVCSETFAVNPLQLEVAISAPGSVNYAQAGGQMAGEALLSPAAATISLVNAGAIPPPYLSSSSISIRYTTDGTDPAVSATAVTGPEFSGSFVPIQVPLALNIWGTNASITVRAVALTSKPDWFTASEPATSTSSRTPTSLSLDILPVNPIGLPPQVLVNESGSVPAGLRKFYTADGTAPLTSTAGGVPAAGASLYNGPVLGGSLPSSSYIFTAQATGPEGYESWFASPLSTKNYNAVTTLPSEFVGANISGGDVNGIFRGSIFVSAPATLGIFNAGGRITGGNLYVPGLPAIETPGSGNSSKTVVARGQPYVEQGQIPRSLIGGVEYTASGQLAVPQLDTRQVVDLNGAVTPNNYTVKLTKSAYIEGKIYRRADAPPPPPVPIVPSGLPVFTNSISGTFTNAIPSGVYSNRITMNSTNSVLRLGTPGSSSQYIFSGNTWNKGTVEVLGPVEIFFLDGFDNKGVIFGSSNNVVLGSTASLRINVMTNAVDITGGGTVYASVWAANSAVTVGNASFFYGSLYAKTLTVAPNGTVDVD